MYGLKVILYAIKYGKLKILSDGKNTYFFSQFIVEILNQLEIFLSIRTCYFDRFDRSIMCKNNSIDQVFSIARNRTLSLYTHKRRTSTFYVSHHRTIDRKMVPRTFGPSSNLSTNQSTVPSEDCRVVWSLVERLKESQNFNSVVRLYNSTTERNQKSFAIVQSSE